jgi:hypothetical protein
MIPTDTRTSFMVFTNYRFRRHLVAFEKRFRLLELPPAEIRPEFDCNTSNAGMLQSGMPQLARRRYSAGAYTFRQGHASR